VHVFPQRVFEGPKI